jgi:hypothetical protein
MIPVGQAFIVHGVTFVPGGREIFTHSPYRQISGFARKMFGGHPEYQLYKKKSFSNLYLPTQDNGRNYHNFSGFSHRLHCQRYICSDFSLPKIATPVGIYSRRVPGRTPLP